MENIKVTDNLENSILSVLLTDKDKRDYIFENCKIEYFTTETNRKLFSIMKELHINSDVIDLVTVYDTITKRELNIPYNTIREITFSYSIGQYINKYIKLLKEQYTKLQATKNLENIIVEINTIDTLSIQEIADKIGNLSFSYSDVTKSNLKSIDDLFNEATEKQDTKEGLKTGLTELDEMTAGFNNSELIFIGARPSMGKTAIMLQIIINMLISNHKILCFSVEMSGRQLHDRIISNLTGINSNKIKKQDLNGYEVDHLIAKYRMHLYKKDLYIDDSNDINILYIKNKARYIKRTYGLDILFIDYLQLVRPDKQYSSKVLELEELSRELKLLANELNIPVVVLTQLNRENEKRTNKRPFMSDLRHSGSLEQDADLILLLHREEYYLKGENKKIPEGLKDLLEVIVAKQRNGPTGIINLKFIKEFMKIQDFNLE